MATAVGAGLVLGATTAGAAAAPAGSYLTRGGHVRVFAAPSTHSATVQVLARGTRVRTTCYTRAQAVHGDRIWYRTNSPAAGYVSGAYLATGRDPARGVPSCPR